MNDRHLDDETIAALAERVLEGGAMGRRASHLSACPSCVAAFAEAVGARAQALGEAPPELSEDLRDLARGLDHEVQSAGSEKRANAGDASARSPRFTTGVAAGVLLGLALALIGARFLPSNTAEEAATVRAGIPEEIAEGIRLAASTLPGEGMVFPGFPDLPQGEGDPAPVLRSNANGTERLGNHGEPGPTLAWLRASYGERPDAELAYLLVVISIADGRLESAAAYLGDARKRYPAEARLISLAGILAYRNSELEKAAELFRKAHAANPEDETNRLNLAQVLVESGRAEEARALLDALRRSTLAPIRRRAETIAESL